jgi:hypothetical protein
VGVEHLGRGVGVTTGVGARGRILMKYPVVAIPLGLFTGCAAGDAGATVVSEVTDG